MTEPQEWTIAIEGGQVFAMPEAERWADIVEPAPEYKLDADMSNPEKQKTKLICTVKTSDGRVCSYYMNRTSARFIAGKLKTDLTKEGMKKWVSHRIYWGKILDQMVGGQQKKVLYVSDVKPLQNGIVVEKPN